MAILASGAEWLVAHRLAAVFRARFEVASCTVERRVGRIQREAGQFSVVKSRQREAAHLTLVAAQTILLALFEELAQVRIEMAVGARAAGGTRVAAAVLQDLGQRRMTRGARGVGVCAAQLEAGPGAVVKDASGSHAEGLGVVAARTATLAVDLFWHPRSVEIPSVRTGVAGGTGGRVAGILILHAPESCRLVAEAMAAFAACLLVRSAEGETGPGAVVEGALLQRGEAAQRMAAFAAAAPFDLRCKPGQIKTVAMNVGVATGAQRRVARMQLLHPAEGAAIFVGALRPRVAGFAVFDLVTELQRETGPGPVIEGLRQVAEGGGGMTACAASRWIRFGVHLAREEGLVMGIAVAVFAQMGQRIEAARGWILSVCQGMAAGTLDLCVAARKGEAVAIVAREIEAVWQKGVARVTGQAGALLVRGPVELSLMRVLVAFLAGVGGASGVAQGEVVGTLARVVAGAAGETVVRPFQREAAGAVPGILPIELLTVELRVQRRMAQHAAILTGSGGRIGQGGEEGRVVRAVVAGGASAPWCRPLRIAERGDRVLAVFLVAVAALQTGMGSVQGHSRIVREAGEVVEGVLLTVALFAAALHRAFMRIFMAGSAILRQGQETRTAFRKFLAAGVQVAVGTLKRVMTPGEMKGNRAVIESVRTLQAGLVKTELHQPGAVGAAVFRVTRTALALSAFVKVAVQTELPVDLILNQRVALEAGAGQVVRAAAVAQHTAANACQLSHLGVRGHDRTGAGLVEIDQNHRGHRQRRQEGEYQAQGGSHPRSPKSA